jgi:hypothetical protein
VDETAAEVQHDTYLLQNISDQSHAVMQTEIAEEDEDNVDGANSSKSAEPNPLEFKRPDSVSSYYNDH